MVRSYAAGNEQGRDIAGARRSQSLRRQIFHHRPLKRGHQIQGLGVAMQQVILKLGLLDDGQRFSPRLNRRLEAVNFHVPQHRGFDSAVREIKARFEFSIAFVFLVAVLVKTPVPMLELGRGKPHSRRVALHGQPVNDGTAWVPQPQQLRDFVEGLAGRIVPGVTNVLVRPARCSLLRQVKMGVSTRDYQGQDGELDLPIVYVPLFEQNGMDMAFQVIHGNQRLIERKGQCFGVADSNQQGAGQAWSLSHSQRVDGLVTPPGIGQRFADHGHNRLQVLPRSQLRNHAAIRLVHGDLREDHVRQHLFSRTNHRGGGLVARAFNAENVTASHVASLNLNEPGQPSPAASAVGSPAGRLQYPVMSSGNPSASPATEPVSSLYDTRLPQLSCWRRMQIPLIASAVITIIRVLGPTLRFEELGMHHYRQSRARGEPVISAFWHRCIISATWYWRNGGAVVMNTTNFDGQWTRRVIEHFGFGTAQGSSTRGGLRGLAVMAQRLEEGFDAAFTIDGPRGPRYVANPGPVMLARKTGCPVMVFHVGVDRGKTFTKTWDHFLMPMPFARTVILFAPPIYVPADADQQMLEAGN